MAVSDIRLITVSCDIAGCDHEIACGADPLHARKNGWKRIMASTFDTDEQEEFPTGDVRDICPPCYKNMMVFLNGEDNATDEAKAKENDKDDGFNSEQ